MLKRLMVVMILFGLAMPMAALAEEAAAVHAETASQAVVQAPKIDTGDTTWVLVSSALVMLMTPGLALFYGGMVRKKNVLGTIMQSFVALGIVTIQWVVIGYSLSFGPDKGGLIGGFEWLGLANVGLEPNADYAGTIPHQAFMIFQMMFAVITPALISGAFAERMRFSAYIAFITLWTFVVYDPVCHWVWGIGGWIRNTGALDFAGGTVVHITSGISALAGALVMGKRKGYGTDHMAPHNLTMTLVGAALLWFGWFGFNGGSAVASGSLATNAFVVTHIAAAAAALSWMVVEWIHRGKPTALGLASGLVAGLVAITPASGFVGPMSSVALGMAVGAVCYISVSLVKPMFGYDDSLDAFGVHGVGGAFGAIATGLFASKAVNSAGSDGLFFGNSGLLWTQAVAVVAVAIYAFVISLALLKLIDWTIGLRVATEDEMEGLDLSQHGESGYVN